MAIDDAGNPHVTFYDPSQRRLCYASRKNTGWYIEYVGDLEQAGRFNSICLDLNGNPVIIIAQIPLRLCLAHLYEHGWDIETIDGVDVFETPTSIGVGSDGVINIMITPRSEDVSILLIRGQSRDWSFHPVPGVDSIHSDPILRVNNVAGPFIIYNSYEFQCAVWKNDHFDVELMSQEVINEYDTTIDLSAYVYHDSLETLPAALVVAMQFGDRFWFYPSWTEEFHAHPILLLPAKYGAEYMIVNHSFTTDAEFHLTFWAALLTPDLTQIIGGDNGIDSIDITCSPG